MSTPLRRLALVAALCSQSCLSCLFTSPPPTTCSSSSVFPSTPQPEEVHAAGQPVTLTLTHELTTYCSDQSPPTVSSVTLEVSDPDNRPVDAAATKPVQGTGPYGNEAWSTTVTFTPSQPGAYHLLATFEPGVALVQRDVWVVVDRRGEAPTSLSLPPSNCFHLERTTAGGAVCQGSQGGVTLFRGGAQIASWQYAGMRVAGDIIWVVGGTGGVSRNLDTGTGPPQLTATASALLGSLTVAATADEAMVWSNDRLRLFHFAGSSLSPQSEVVLSLSVEARAVAFSSAARSLVVADWNRWARLELPPGTSTPSPSWTENQTPAFQAPDGIWVELDGTTWRFLPADPTQPSATLVAPTGWQNTLDQLGTVRAGERPLLFPTLPDDPSGFEPRPALDTSQVLVPTVNGSTISLSAFSAPPDAGFVEVTQGQLRASRGNEQFFWNLNP